MKYAFYLYFLDIFNFFKVKKHYKLQILKQLQNLPKSTLNLVSGAILKYDISLAFVCEPKSLVGCSQRCPKCLDMDGENHPYLQPQITLSLSKLPGSHCDGHF